MNNVLQLLKTNKQIAFLLGVCVVITIMIIVIIISVISQSTSNPTGETPIPTVTPLPVSYTPATYNRNPQGSFRFSPFSKTEINKTTDPELPKDVTILSKSSLRDGTTIYKIKSNAGDIPDEVRTKNGVVTFEKTTTLVSQNYGPLPNLTAYTSELGQPEKIVPIGNPEYFVVAYIYASKGVTIHLNSNTKTVYEILRYNPMSVDSYIKAYPEYLKVLPPDNHQPVTK